MIFPPATTQELAVTMAKDLQKLKKTLKKIDVKTATASVKGDEVTTMLIRSELVLTSATAGYQKRNRSKILV